MRVLVSGGAGMVGSHLCDSLIADGHEIVAVDNFITGRRANIAHLNGHPSFTLLEQDVLDPIEAGRLDRVYHLASPASPQGYMSHPIETHLVNSMGTKALLELARRDGARFLFTSTSEIYGNPLVHPQPETYFGNVNPIGPRSCYDESKRFGESITMEFVRQFGTDARIVRLFNIYGPRNDPEDGRIVPAFISGALRGEPLPIHGDGHQTRSLCYVQDLVAGLRSAMEIDGLGGMVINLGNPDERSVIEIAEIINKLCDSPTEMTFQPPREDDPERRCPDITLAESMLDWRPTTSLEQGLQETIKYFRDHEGIARSCQSS